MSVWEGAQQAQRSIIDSSLFRGTLATGVLLLALLCILAILLCITYLLRVFFKKHPLVNKAHRLLIYLLTMTGVLALLLAGVVGVLLPVIPGLVFVFIALLLMRRYHRWKWLDERIERIRKRVRRTKLGRRFAAWRVRVRKRRQERLQEKLNKAARVQSRRHK